MSEAVDRLLGEYIAEHRAGGIADPREYLSRATSEPERVELAALIDGYLARAPRQRWDAESFRGSSAERVADGLERAIAGTAGLWPVELPRLRERARLRRAEVVQRLATALGVAGREEKVAGYYHEMEQGLLPASGVSERVLDALAQIVGTTAEALRRAGEAVSSGPPAEGAGGPVFARRAVSLEDAAPPSTAPAETAEREADWDEVDDLFRGGP